MNPPLELFFDGAPRQIRALRRVLGWTRMDLARYLGVYVNRAKHDSNTVGRWETGDSAPAAEHRDRMFALAAKFADEYMAELIGHSMQA